MNRLLWVVSLILILAAGWITYNLEQDLDDNVFSSNIRSTYELLATHESLIEAVLEVYGRSNKDYDKISHLITQTRKQSAEILKSFQSSENEEIRELSSRLSNIQQQFEAQFLIIEDYKTSNAQMLNSVTFLPTVSDRVLDNLSPYRSTERRDVQQLTYLAMQAHSTRTSQKYQAANDYLKNLEARAVHISDEETRVQLRLFCDHVSGVLDYSTRTDEILDQYEGLEDAIEEQIKFILNRLVELEQQAINKLDIHKNLLWLLALFLIFIATYYFLRNLNSLRSIREKESQREQAYITLKNNTERIRITLESIGDGVITTNLDGQIDYMNPVAEKLTGWSNEDALHRTLMNVFNVIHDITRKPIENPVDVCLRNAGVINLTSHSLLINKSGKEIAIEDSAAPIQDGEGNIVGVVLVFHDVSVQRVLKKELSWQATHDSLTGLINRAEFERRLDNNLSASSNTDISSILMFIDLDNFKIVNDTAGHIAGDEVLRNIAISLSEIIRDSDTLARLGGDEFGVLLVNCSMKKGEEIAQKIIDQINRNPFQWNDNQFQIGASIGLVCLDSNTPDMHQALSAADLACYAAKEHGRNQAHTFDIEDETTGQRRNEMEQVSLIRQAIEQDKFVLYKQPVYRARSREIFGYEILIRLQDDELIMPDQFIPAAERFNLMSEIDQHVIKMLFDYINSYAEGNRNIRYFINLSGQSFNNSGLPSFMQTMFNTHDVKPGNIFFEITETSVISNMIKARHLIEEVRKLGCCFSLDDFGTGLSSYAYLRYLPVEHLKIDGSFVRDMTHDTVNEAIVRSITELARSLQLETVAEMVEDEETLIELNRIGIDYVQGYHTGRPTPLIDIKEN